ncbi:hypothetical protein ScPMuIL_001361 [Solemya velum]
MISMAGGNPNSSNFPLTEATLTLRDGSKLTVDPDSLKQALQYSATPGQDGICKALEAMTSVDDNVLMEIPCYVGTLSIVRPRGLNFSQSMWIIMV